MRSLVFDTETTALITNSVIGDRYQPRVIEFYGMIVDDQTGAKIEELEFLCDPGSPIGEETTKITGIKPEDVKGLPGFSAFVPRVRAFIESADEAVAHNLYYDRFVIDREFKRADASPIKWPRMMTCTVEQTEHLGGRRMSLGDLHAHLFGEKFAGAHRAREDVEALGKCFLDLRQKGEI